MAIEIHHAAWASDRPASGESPRAIASSSTRAMIAAGRLMMHPHSTQAPQASTMDAIAIGLAEGRGPGWAP